ncbi:leucine-rich repeat-containing protein 7-like [Daphnia carinata]|uniref:leucine-rich repeat-containing protein 7-like n=1 Tax=Daphnia carinata TaxID=120202 RepID=UPI00257F2EBB|nr:leucine-rich repeat-containing protein 7-like [Daphnia carinata]
MDTNDDRGAGEAMLKGSGARRMATTSSGWRKILMCCLKPEEDDVQVLDYEHSSLTEVPAVIFSHERTLEVLRLDCNQIADLPRPLFHCHGLKELWLSDNEISQLPPALASLIHLQVLDISKNALSEVPDAISGLKALITLDLSVNPLGKLPEGATKLLSLESLNLSDTFLEFLPANFGRLTKLRLLELRENQLASLPKSMARLTALKRLDMGQNDLCDLPEVVGSIPSLTELWVDGNKLDVLPEFLGHLQNLVHLDASRNCLHGIAPTIGLCKSLTDLSLTSNNLANLPEEIGDLTLLTVLRVDDNRLTCLPDSLGRLSHLEELQAGQNRLSKLPASIGLLRKLETLMLNENLLDELPVELGSCQRLTVLSLRKNRLEHLPPELGHLSRLRVINLSCNRLLHLPVSFLKLPSLSALWLSEAQTKPVVPLQTDIDSSTGHKVLTCFLLPQSADPEAEEQTPADKGSPNVVTARSPTHIKFAFDGEADPKAGKLMRNPTPYPKELKALAKHAQHIQQHHPVSPTARNSVDLPTTGTTSPSETKGQLKKQPEPLPVAVVPPQPAAPSTTITVHVDPTVTIISKSPDEPIPVQSEPSNAPIRPKPEIVLGAPQPLATPSNESQPEVPPLLPPVHTSLTLEPKRNAPVDPVHTSLTLEPKRNASVDPVHTSLTLEAKRNASVENLADPEVDPPKPNGIPAAAEHSPRSAEIEIKEARVLRPLMSAADGLDKVKNPTDVVDRSSQPDLTAEVKQQPPPYHVAAVYSKRAAEFNHATSLPRTQSTDSGFTVEGTSGERRDSSPSRDSGRGPSIEPLEDNAQPSGSPGPAQSVVAAKRPVDLPLNGSLADREKMTPLALKRATYIIDNSLSPNDGTEAVEETGDLQSVAALRQAAREVFLSASPKESPLPAHKQTSWDVPLSVHTTNGSSNTLSAANVVGLPPAGNSSENGGQQPPAKIQGRLPPPKYHVTSNGFRDTSAELKSPPPASASSRIPLASHNRLPSGLPRQLSNLSNSSLLDGPIVNKPAPLLPPKKRDSPPPPTLQPKLSTSRIPPPQVHTPVLASPLTPLSLKTNFSPLPVHNARLVTPTTTPLTPTTNNNDFESNQSNKITPSQPLTTRIPLPKYSASDISKTGVSPGSRIPTRLPTPTTSIPSISKSKLSADLTGSPSLASYTSRIQ